jgi:Rieske Fe-S protein
MKWGLSTATAAAILISDSLNGVENPWASTFSPNRLSLRSLPELAQANSKVGFDFVADRLRPGEASRVEDVPRGEARVVRQGLGKKGVFRGEDGAVPIVSMRCTHLGCLLRFNSAERSWDCPCHGSRFTPAGDVLQGPAVHRLERKPIE